MSILRSETVRLAFDAPAEAILATINREKWPVYIPVNEWTEFQAALQTDSGAAIQAAALHYYRSRHPHANRRDVASAATLVARLATNADLDIGTQDYERQRWIERLMRSAIHEPTPEATEIALRLMEALYFEAQPEDEKMNTIRQAIDILVATRSTFKSKQVERARELLESLLK